ncbi:mRNA-decapping enzyme subunit 2 [Cichlidogyrus casuarinus]|uniref:mRNA-decapping enzyme subunit 2 n=1 Tax=Cichlidogyrus casuarinus TaxID=1844966 RepID=A0ABD2QER5_9PLAT
MVRCASREVYEETSLKIDNYVNESVYIDRYFEGTLKRAYIIEGLPKVKCEPVTKNEIEAITWFKLDDLPISSQDYVSVSNLNLKPNQFYLVQPYIKNYVKLRLAGHSPQEAIHHIGPSEKKKMHSFSEMIKTSNGNHQRIEDSRQLFHAPAWEKALNNDEQLRATFLFYFK